MSSEKDSTLDDFLEHAKSVFTAVKALEDKGLSRDYIVRLLRYIADWLEGMDANGCKGKYGLKMDEDETWPSDNCDCGEDTCVCVDRGE